MADGTEPIALAMVICDAIHIDPGIGKRTLLGLFTTVFSREFPATIPAMAVHIAITECRGTFPIKLQVIDVNEDREPVSRVDGEISFDDPLATLEIDFRLGGVQFPEPGEYRVQFFAANEPIIERKVIVAPAPGVPPEPTNEPTDQ